MVLAESVKPSIEQIEQLRTKFHEKLKNEPPANGDFHPADIARLNNGNKWIEKFLINNDLNLDSSLKQLWDTFTWRKEFGTNDITAESIRQDYRDMGLYFPSTGRDIDGKRLFMFRCKVYTRGSADTEELKKVLIYWVERTIREEDGDCITAVFDMMDCGLSNIDLPFTQFIISTLKNYYPEQINYILIYDMAWILTATFQIIKKLLPAKAVARLKFLYAKNVKDYVDDINQPSWWGGKNTYEHSWTEEIPIPNSEFAIKPLTNRVNWHSEAHEVTNNNNNNNKKVHFAPESHTIQKGESQLPTAPTMEKMINSNNDSQMLRVTPNEAIIFTKVENDFTGQVKITNIDSNPVTYKIKTTAPEKFRVRPSSGVLLKGATQTINVIFNQGHTLNSLNRDKFLVMCMSLAPDESTDQQHLADLWKNTSTSNPNVEQHRLRCQLPDGTKEGSKNGANYDSFDSSGNIGDRTQSQLNHTLQCINDTLHRLEGQARWTHTIQWLTCLLFILLSVCIIYILKVEINNSSYEYCMKQ